jgi:hypothetical protein
MQCVVVDSSGYLLLADPQPVEVMGCGLVVVTPDEVSASPFILSSEEAGQISGAILAVWCLGYIVRQLARVGNLPDEKES